MWIKLLAYLFLWGLAECTGWFAETCWEVEEDATNSAKLVTVQLITVAVFSFARHGAIPYYALYYVVYVYRY